MARKLIGSIKDTEPYLGTIIENNDSLTKLLIASLRKPLFHEEACLHPVTELPENSSPWLRNEWAHSGSIGYPMDTEQSGSALYYAFKEPPSGSATDNKVRIIAKWLEDLDKEGKLKIDKQGRVVELIGINSLNDAVKIATGYPPPLDIPRPGALMEWEKNYYFVKLDKLDDIYNAQEGLLNQRKEVKEDYDIAKRKHEIALKIADGIKVYCLHGKPSESYPTGVSALLEVDKKGVLVKCEGRQYQPPTEPAIEYVRQFITAQNFDLGAVKPKWTSLIKVNGKYQNIFNLKKDFPNGFSVERDLDLSDIKHRIELPDNITIRGRFSLRGSHIDEYPNDTHAQGRVDVSRTCLKNLGNNTQFNGLNISNSEVASLNDGTHIHGDLHLEGTPIQVLPNDGHPKTKPRLIIDGNIILNDKILNDFNSLSHRLLEGSICIMGQIKNSHGCKIDKPEPRFTAREQQRDNVTKYRC